jgi:hypothetical protein
MELEEMSKWKEVWKRIATLALVEERPLNWGKVMKKALEIQEFLDDWSPSIEAICNKIVERLLDDLIDDLLELMRDW